jgi:chemotaxis protein CheX
MNVKFLNPFIEAAYEVLKTETKNEIQRGELRLDNDSYVTDDLTVILSLVGAVVGTVFYSMNLDTGIELASKIMGERFEKFDILAQSGIAELGNVITGRASMKLAEAGYESTISPPALILGKGATISTLDYARLVVPLKTNAGLFMIHLALRFGTTRDLSTPQIAIPRAFEKPAV